MYSIFFFIFLISVHANDLIVKTVYGPVKGVVEKTQYGSEILAYYSVPYAAPPVGALRLKPPVEPKPWTSLRNVTHWPSSCLQPDKIGNIVGDEDCLYLNIFTPRRSEETNVKLPVMVFIYGGGFHTGDSSKYQPGYLLEKSVILVTLNYRLGALGFLGYGTEELPGNFGLKDQSFALKWVRNNIEQFGGNPNEVTLFGQSAGSASVHTHAFSPLSKGLFHRAIMQSGTATSAWCIYKTDDARAQTIAFGVMTGCYRKNLQKMVSCFQKLKSKEFVQAEAKLYAWSSDPITLFRPMIEGNDVKDAALPKELTPENYQSRHIPWIIGINTGEMTFRVLEYIKNDGKLLNEMNEEYQRILPLVLHYQFSIDSEKLEQISDTIKEHYFQNKSIGVETDVEVVKMLTDFMFVYPIDETLKNYPGQKYFYVYDHKVECSGPGSLGCYKKEYGVSHSDEIPLLFPMSTLPFEKMTPFEKYLSGKLVEFWTNFAAYSDPNGPSANKTWEPVTSKDGEYLHITSRGLKMEKNYNTERLEFWRKLFAETT